jgi:hypothetical protein
LIFAPVPFLARVDNEEIVELKCCSAEEEDFASFLNKIAKMLAIKNLVN